LNNEIGEQTRHFVKKLKEKGVAFTFATQRIHSSICPFARELGINIPIITLNGALIKDINGGIISSSVIKESLVRKALRLADKYFVRIALCYGDEILYTENNSVLRDYMYRIGTDYRLVDSYENFTDNVMEIIMLGNEKNVMKHIQNKMNFPGKFFLTAKYFRSNSKTGVYNLEIRKSGTSKKTGMKKLAKHLGLRKTEIAVMGDWFNDRDLFEFGGFNVAMQNAVAELKFKADYITEKNNEEDGVGEFLKLVYESK
jgi:Cof subfamily protein (haloacid dehalogenase superfamily)